MQQPGASTPAAASRAVRLESFGGPEVLNLREVPVTPIGEDYAVPSPESTAAIRELARHQGIFVGPVYTGKGLAGMLDHARTGQIPPGSNVAFLHTGDTGNLSEIAKVAGDITGLR